MKSSGKRDVLKIISKMSAQHISNHLPKENQEYPRVDAFLLVYIKSR